MSRKLVAEVLTLDHARVVRVQWDNEWEEFRVVHGESVYHTGSRGDAIGTASAMPGAVSSVLIARKGFGILGEA